MKPRLLNYLVCPDCRKVFSLEIKKQEGEEIMEGSLSCATCGKIYFIVRGIPRILSKNLTNEKQATASAFGYEWTHFTEFSSLYQDQFLEWIKPVTREFFKDKVILDAGCGKGRHVILSEQFGAREVIGIDLSQAVEIAFTHTRNSPNVHIIQADIYHLPFAAPFDYIYSIGVLHHLPDPRAGFESLVKHIKPGGRISAWVYGKEGNWWIEKLLNPVRIRITSRLPKAITKFIAWCIAVPFQLVLKLVYRPVNHWPVLTGIKRFLFYNNYLYSISGFSFQENYSIIFDHLVAPTAFYIPQDEFRTWFSGAKLEQVEISAKTGNSWRGTGVKTF